MAALEGEATPTSAFDRHLERSEQRERSPLSPSARHAHPSSPPASVLLIFDAPFWDPEERGSEWAANEVINNLFLQSRENFLP